MALVDMYVLILKGMLGGQQHVNVFQYEKQEVAIDPGDAIEPLIDSFIDVFFGGLTGDLDSDLFTLGCSYTEIEAYNLADPTAFGTRSIAFSGLQSTSEGMPKFVAYGFFSNRRSRAIRRGMKRFAGVPEIAANAGVIAANFLADLEFLAANLGLTMTTPITAEFTFDPVVIKRVKYTTSEGKTAYRFPETDGELDFFLADDWTPYTELTSQNTRKTGRGV